MTAGRDARATLHFAIPYWTEWGQNLVVILCHGSEGSRRHALVCRHQGDDLLWDGEVQVSANTKSLEYSYAITDEAAEIKAEEVSKRSLALPEGLTDGSIVELRDCWQVRVPPSPIIALLQHVNAHITHVVKAICLCECVGPRLGLRKCCVSFLWLL